MRKSTRAKALAVAALACALLPLAAVAQDESPSSIPPGWRFTLPPGDAPAGEAVFRALKCWSCHQVAGVVFEEAGEQDGRIGPRLTGAHAALPREYIAERLIRYDRFLEEGFRKATWSRSDGTSRMGNYNEAISVRELIDLVEFIRSIESMK